MPYAAHRVVSTDPFEGAIEITTEQYRAAVEGMVEGMVVSIEGGFSVEFPPQPEQPSEAPPTPAELRVVALAQRDALMAVAATRMAPLQYAVDLGDATADEEAMLAAWKRYSVDLNRIEQQETFPDQIDWPVSPDMATP
ncbi:tail fiber assembly protein [Pseudomonas qingdaonensis]|uniref:tail fiber assembly protein n=1 Tax=Pseudomonas qingdaonensis TaxID=2056231 RepID=UPI0036906D5C